MIIDGEGRLPDASSYSLMLASWVAEDDFR